MFLYVLGLLPIPVQILIALNMHRRRQHLLYPAFWTYLWFESTRLALECILWPTPWNRLYFFVYWISGFISILFALAILREIFSKVLADYSQLTAFRRRGYEIALAIISLTAIVFSARVHGRVFFTREIIQIQQAVGIVAVAMLVFVAGASVLLGIRWRSELCGIASAMGLLGMGDVVAFTLTLLRERYTPHLIGWIESIAYDTAFILLAAYFLVPAERTAKPAVKDELVRWVFSMSESLRK